MDYDDKASLCIKMRGDTFVNAASIDVMRTYLILKEKAPTDSGGSLQIFGKTKKAVIGAN
jgi:hypothetical protein